MTGQHGPRKYLPGTGLAVSPLCLGGNRLGSELDESASFKLLDAYVELGGNFLDTALVYSDWIDGIERSCSERTIGRWLDSRGNRESMVVATKGGHPSLNHPGMPRLDATSLRNDAQESAEHLGGAPIDLYYLHRDDPARPIPEVLESLEALVAEGLIRHYAASNFSAKRLAEAHHWAVEHNIPGFVAHQLEWSLARPRHDSIAPDLTWMDESLTAFHRETKLTAIPYSSQARGYFDKATPGHPAPESVRRYDTANNETALRTVSNIAGELGVDGSTVALAGLLHTDIPTVPVIGCRTVEQLRGSWSALSLDLSPEGRERLASFAMAGC